MLFIDFETRSTVDLKVAGADVYARDPSTEILCLGYAFNEDPPKVWKGLESSLTPPEFSEHVGSGGLVVAHNAPFELAIWNSVAVPNHGWPTLSPDQMICTMALCYAMALPAKLEDAAPALGLKINKDSQGHRIMLQLSKPRGLDDEGNAVWWSDPDKYKKLYAYCKQDIEVERAVFKRLMRLSPAEQRLWILDRKINDRGVELDVSSVKAAIKIAEIERESFDYKIREITSGAVKSISAVGQFTSWLRAQGLEISGVGKADVSSLLKDHSIPERCRQALILRQEAAKSSVAKLEAMLAGVCEDGRLRGMFQYHGAGATGRFAGRRVQLQNLPRPKLTQDQIDHVFQILGQVQ